MNAEQRACRDSLRQGSRSFFLAGLLLPKRVLEPATALYAFCRVADDLVDTGAEPGRSLEALRWRVAAIYDGRPGPHPADRALARVVAAHAIPRPVFDDLLEGFAWDLERRRYDDLPALEAYAARVAGTVGTAMAVLMGARSAFQLDRAAELGIAMQLTNIARDVGEDARAGRLYLPLAWLREEGVDAEAFLASPVFSPGLARVIVRLLAEADRRYARAEPAIGSLPKDCRVAIAAARHLYAAIGEAVARRGHDSVAARASLGFGRKLWVMRRAVAPARSLGITDRTVWVLNLFSELDLRQAGRS